MCIKCRDLGGVVEWDECLKKGQKPLATRGLYTSRIRAELVWHEDAWPRPEPILAPSRPCSTSQRSFILHEKSSADRLFTRPSAISRHFWEIAACRWLSAAPTIRNRGMRSFHCAPITGVPAPFITTPSLPSLPAPPRIASEGLAPYGACRAVRCPAPSSALFLADDQANKHASSSAVRHSAHSRSEASTPDLALRVSVNNLFQTLESGIQAD